MRRIPVFIVCIVLLSSIAQLAVAQQWPSGDWNSEVMVTNDYAHWNLRNTGEGVTREGNMFTIKAGGDDIGGRTDQFTYAYKEVSGDFEVWATVYTLENTNEWTKAGIMARQGLNTGAENAMIACRGANDLAAFQWREIVNGGTYGGEVSSKGVIRPVTLRLIRKGDEFTSGWSLNYGKTWEQGIATTSALVEMRDPILLGIAVTSHKRGTITSATVEVGPPPPSRTLPEGSFIMVKTERAVNKGDTFSAAINISDIGGDSAGIGIQLMAFRLHISFDPNILEVVEINEGSLLPSVGATNWTEPNINNAAGNITDIESSLIGEWGPDVGGTLAVVTFKAIGTGESYIRSVGRYYMKSPDIEVHDSRWKPVIVVSRYGSVTVYDSANVDETTVFQNYPNPFNPETWIPYQLAESSDVTIRVHGATGQLIRTLDMGNKKAGSYVTKDAAAYWDGTNDAGEHVSSGVYFYSIHAGEHITTRKMIIAQ